MLIDVLACNEMRSALFIGVSVVNSDYSVLSTRIDGCIAIHPALACVTFSLNGIVQDASDQYASIFGYERHEIIGCHHSIFLTPEDAQSPEYVQFWKSLGNGIAQTNVFRRVKRNGEFAWIQGTYFPIRSQDGEILRVFKLATDITSKKNEESRSKSIVDSIDQSLAMAELLTDGTIIRANSSFHAIFDYNDNELAGKNHRQLVPRVDRESPEYREFWQALRRGEYQVSQFKRASKHGKELWIQGAYNPIFDANGRVTAIVKYAFDLSQRKQFEHELKIQSEIAQAANQSKSEFLANMSHEIRTPMTAILGYTELLLNEADYKLDDQQRIQVIHTIQRNGEHLLNILDDILDLSKIEAGKLAVEIIECSPVRIIEEVVSSLQVRADSRKIALLTEFQTPMPDLIHSDPTRLRQILINLVGNAIKFTRQGTVTLQARLINFSHPQIEIDVVDTGIGISRELHSKLFTFFSQADSSTTREFGGTGLGLSISKRLAGMLGGDVVLVQSAPNQGSTFRVTLNTGVDHRFPSEHPKVQALQSDCSNSRKTTKIASETGSLQHSRILLAEDGVDNQKLIAFFLRRSGAHVTVVDNGQLAVDAVLCAMQKEEPYDVVLMDMQMPVCDGYQATNILRQRSYQGCIIALTAHAMAGDRQKCLSAGCNDYVTKPINRELLFETIGRHLPVSAY